MGFKYSRLSDKPLSRLLINFYNDEIPLALYILIFIILLLLFTCRILLYRNATLTYFRAILSVTIRFNLISFPLRKVFKCSIPNDTFMLEHFNFWLVAMSPVILIASFYGMCEEHSSLKSYLIVNLILVL